MTGETLFGKIWDAHVVHKEKDGPSLMYVDRHFVHEVTSPQAFEGLRAEGRRVRRPDLTFATIDHNVPTVDRLLPTDPVSAAQIEALVRNCREFGITLYDLQSADNGIVHVIGPELGITLPGITVACGDSHTTTHGALGALAFGIGTSEVEHVLATQCIWTERPESFEVKVEGKLGRGITAKDLILYIVGRLGTSGGAGSVIEYRGEGIENLSVEERMTICNMSVEAGAKAGIIAPDEKTFEYLRGRRYAPKGDDFDNAVEDWKHLESDGNAEFDRHLKLDAGTIAPQVTWGTNPAMVADVTGLVPSPSDFDDPSEQKAVSSALKYMGLAPSTRIVDIKVDRVFIGSCTNGRLTDLVAAASVANGRRILPHVRAMVVPGSQRVKREAEEKGLDKIFKDAGFEWRESGCSMCLGMNPDVLQPGERCASTTNRNFEGRQGRGGRTHLVSPIMAAAAAVAGHFVDIREWGSKR